MGENRLNTWNGCPDSDLYIAQTNNHTVILCVQYLSGKPVVIVLFEGNFTCMRTCGKYPYWDWQDEIAFLYTMEKDEVWVSSMRRHLLPGFSPSE